MVGKMTIFDAKNQTFDGFSNFKKWKIIIFSAGQGGEPKSRGAPDDGDRGNCDPLHEDLANSVNHQTWEILSVKLGNSSIKQGGECRFKHGEFEILTPNIGKIVKPESKMSRMEIYSKNHNILNTIYVIMCMGFCRDHRFLPCGQCRKLAIGNWE